MEQIIPYRIGSPIQEQILLYRTDSSTQNRFSHTEKVFLNRTDSPIQKRFSYTEQILPYRTEQGTAT